MKKTITAMLVATSITLASFASVAAEMSAGALLERGIYQEETVGDLQAAAGFYQQVLDNAEVAQPYLAEAIFRQANIHYLKGDNQKALMLLQQLVQSYPEQIKFVNNALEMIAEVSLSTSSYLSAPWGDFETVEYQLLSPAGAPMGQASMVIRKVDSNGEAMWHHDEYLISPMNQIQEFSRSIIQGDLEKTLSAKRESPQLGAIEYNVDEQGIQYKVSKDGELNQATIDAPKGFYDSKMLPVLLRRLPLAEAYSATIPVFDSAASEILQAKFRVLEANKTVTIAGKTYQAFEVDINLYRAGDKVRSASALVAQDQSRTLLSLGHSYGKIEYVAKHTDFGPRQLSFNYGDKKLSVDSPALWQSFDITSAGPGMKLFVQFTSPQQTANSMLAIKGFPKTMRDSLTPHKVVDGDIAALKSYFKNYTVRKGSRRNIDIDDLPAQEFVADYKFEGKEMVESRVYILGQEDVYWFILRVEKQKYKQVKSDFIAQYKSFSL